MPGQYETWVLSTFAIACVVALIIIAILLKNETVSKLPPETCPDFWYSSYYELDADAKGQWKEELDTDHAGNDISCVNGPVPSLNELKDICKQTPGCVSFGYGESRNKYCLKSKVGPARTLSGWNSYTIKSDVLNNMCGSQYGCCQDKVTPMSDESGSNCPGPKCFNSHKLGNSSCDPFMDFTTAEYTGPNGDCKKRAWAKACGVTWDGITDVNMNC